MCGLYPPVNPIAICLTYLCSSYPHRGIINKPKWSFYIVLMRVELCSSLTYIFNEYFCLKSQIIV